MDNMMGNNAPMMPDHELPPHHAPMSLKIVLLLFALVVVGALSYLVLSDRDTVSDTEEPAAVIVKKKTATATSTATTDETADWKTYTNSTYGFSYKYPADWTSRENVTTSTMAEPWKSFAFYVGNTPPGASDHYQYIAVSKKTVDELIAQEWIGAPIPKRETVTFAGSTATKLTVGLNDAPAGNDSIEYYVVKNGYTFAITGPRTGTTFTAAEKSTWKQVETLVSTFKFTN